MIGQVLCQQCVKTLAVVFLPDVTQFVNHHQIDSLLGVIHEKAGKAEAVSGTAASVALLSGGDFDAGGDKSRFLAPEIHLFRQDGGGFGFQNGDVLCCGGGWGLLGAQALLRQMFCDPVGVPGHEGFDLPVRSVHRGPNQHPAVPCDLQCQSFPMGADQFIMFHDNKIAWLPGKVNRKVIPWWRNCGLKIG